MANVLVSVSQYETEVTAERVLAGQAAEDRRNCTGGDVHKADCVFLSACRVRDPGNRGEAESCRMGAL